MEVGSEDYQQTLTLTQYNLFEKDGTAVWVPKKPELRRVFNLYFDKTFTTTL